MNHKKTWIIRSCQSSPVSLWDCSEKDRERKRERKRERESRGSDGRSLGHGCVTWQERSLWHKRTKAQTEHTYASRSWVQDRRSKPFRSLYTLCLSLCMVIMLLRFPFHDNTDCSWQTAQAFHRSFWNRLFLWNNKEWMKRSARQDWIWEAIN